MTTAQTRPRAAILNSRQSKTPLGIDEWVKRTVAAAQWAADELGADIVSSIEPMPWNLATWAGGRTGAGVHLFVPEIRRDAISLSLDYGLLESQLTLHLLETPAKHADKTWWPERDRAVIEAADVLIPVSIRPGGGLEELVIEYAGRKDVISQFRTPYAPAAHHDRDLLDHEHLNPALHDWPEGYLIHWTRSCHGPWPGETMASYLSDLVNSQTRYCRTALSTLNRILRERRIRGSNWHVGAKQPVVSLTELSPLESFPLMRWRARWSRWSFEPFGIALPITEAKSAGVRPVHYVEANRWKMLPPEDKPFSHSIGKDDPIWPAEREWRGAGDLPLESFSKSSGIIIVRDDQCLTLVHNPQSWNVIPMMIRK